MSSRNEIKIYEEKFDWDKILEAEIALRNQNKDDDPFFVTNIDDVIEKFKYWTKKFPRITPFFAIKCCNNEHVPKVLAKLGGGFDCASKNEIDRILQLVPPEWIIFANTIKQPSHIEYARKKQVFKITFDTPEELKKIKKVFPEAEVVLRIKCESKKTSYDFGDKYACDPKTDGVELVKLCKELNMNLIGCSFHAGPTDYDFEIYEHTLKNMAFLFDFAKTLGMNLKFVDIGGGYKGDNREILDNYEVLINRAIAAHFADPSIQIISEPGQYFATSSSKLVCNVVTKRPKLNPDGSVKYMVYCVNESIHQSFVMAYIRNIMKPPRILASNLPGRKKFPSVIYGITCDGTDKIIEGFEWEEAFVDEWIVFDNVGAYTGVLATKFNDFDKTREISYISKENR